MSDELRAFVCPDETAWELAQRARFDPIKSGISAIGNLRAAQVVELSGPSGAGKTELLVQIIAEQILPKLVGDQQVGLDKAEHVLLLDLDAKFDVRRLCQVLEARLGDAAKPRPASAGAQPACPPLIAECLQRFHLVRCHSSADALSALAALPAQCQRLQEHGGLRLLLLDNVAAFYWVDRSVKLPHGELPGSALTLQAVHAALAAQLTQMIRQLRLAVVATCHTALKPREAGRSEGGKGQAGAESDPQSQFWGKREFLPRAWLDVVTHQLSVRRLPNGSSALKWHSPSRDYIMALPHA